MWPLKHGDFRVVRLLKWQLSTPRERNQSLTICETLIPSAESYASSVGPKQVKVKGEDCRRA